MENKITTNIPVLRTALLMLGVVFVGAGILRFTIRGDELGIGLIIVAALLLLIFFASFLAKILSKAMSSSSRMLLLFSAGCGATAAIALNIGQTAKVFGWLSLTIAVLFLLASFLVKRVGK